ncbi:MAG: dihydroxyacetone kinase subunit L [Desulfobacterales bacterium]|nr:dihydroxyacetone kinase subunit L [Desulfobacterales bacterium]
MELYIVFRRVMCIDGGAAGPLLGSLFMGMSDGVADATELDCNGLAAMFEAGLAGLRKQTRARAGDKTMMDALEPAVAAMRAASDAGRPIAEAFSESAAAADKGALATKDRLARFGRAKNLGDRSLGRQDPGAASIALMFSGFADALQ